MDAKVKTNLAWRKACLKTTVRLNGKRWHWLSGHKTKKWVTKANFTGTTVKIKITLDLKIRGGNKIKSWKGKRDWAAKVIWDIIKIEARVIKAIVGVGGEGKAQISKGTQT